ncbi:hypothetical protein [Actinocatenispora sera]|uniref:Uncharacterized protein n=1 Tax=Actinocatenispora sera TaxID=390989 RepID=A0A810L1P3_9ACTN|nr:hypothetical protein [Actinocatenispora sera]BCJ29354.1 hypothetical protein Asera_34620 [Actinocatenispora sera]
MGILARIRRSRLPVEAKRPFAASEHLVAWAPVGNGHATGGSAGDGYLVATNRGLWLPGRDERLGWHEIHKATWSGRELVVTPARLVRSAGEAPDAPADVFTDDEPVSYRIGDPGELPYQVRVRVTKSVAFSTHHELPNGGVRVVARRIPGVDGLHWALRYDEGTVLIGPDHDLVAEFLAQARNTVETG